MSNTINQWYLYGPLEISVESKSPAIIWGNNSQLKNDQGGSIELGGNSATPGTGIPYIDFHYKDKLEDFNIRIINDADGQLSLVARTTYAAGNVGIGTTAPSARLEVNLANDKGWDGNLKGLRLLSPDNGYFLDVNTYIVSGGNVGYQFSPNGKEGLVITTPGNVGVGTMRPSAKLEVNLANDKGWDGNLKGLRLLSPDNSYFLDVNTYIVSGGNVGYQFSPNSKEGLVITTPGNVGVGTMRPSAKLEVNLANDKGWDGNLKGLRLLSPDNGYFLDVNTYIVSGGNVGYQFSPNGKEGLVITTPGNVGVGTMRPSAKLEVNLANDKGWDGNLKGLRLLSPDNGYFLDVNTYIVSGGNVGYQFSPNGKEGLVITTPGNVGVGTMRPSAKLEVNLANDKGWDGNLKGLRLLSPDNSYFLDVNTYIVSGGNVGYQFSPNSKEGFVITTLGNVGIGTTTPSAKLEVNGTFAVIGDVANENVARDILRTLPNNSVTFGVGSNGDLVCYWKDGSGVMHGWGPGVLGKRL